jgi:hypothetical protein
MSPNAQRPGVANRGAGDGRLPIECRTDHPIAPAPPEKPSIESTTRADAGAPERLAYRESECAAAFGVSERLWQRAVHAGQAPQADLRLDRIKLWSRDLLMRWIASAGSVNGK